MVVNDVSERAGRPFEVRRVSMPASGAESWTLIAPDRRPVQAADEFLAWLTNSERSPNTVEAYARDLKLFWSFLGARGLEWDAVTVADLGEFTAWAPLLRTASRSPSRASPPARR